MDSAAVVAQLSGIALGSSRELDRVCLETAAALLADDVEPPFDVASADFATDAYLICADRYWWQRFLRSPTIRTAAACARWLGDHIAEAHRVEIGHRWALGNAFVTRDNVEEISELAGDALVDIIGNDGAAEDIAFFVTLYHAGKLRANFWHDALLQFLESAPLANAAGPHRHESIFVALRAFGALGSRAITAEHATGLVDQAWNDPHRTRDVVDICLNGLAMATPFDMQGELLRDRAGAAVREYPDDHMFHFRLAQGRHLCADYGAALESVDTALRLLPATGSRVSHGALQEQYLSKRDTIQEGRLRARWDAELRQRWDRQEAANAELARTVRSSSVRSIELLAVFTAAIAFAVGSLQVTLTGSLSLRDRLWLLAAQGGVLAAFSLLVVGGTWLITRKSHRE
ncbi:hypothetical protein AB0I66_34980 [Streptomyces sp. NPDC050439]|uniref:hypothetical protein n=1 Tax=unclassified Streptomyces TaxID=2593676 RepID=UPI003414A272